MSYLSMVEAKLPPGFRFYPRDDELICDYLQPRAVSGDGLMPFCRQFPTMIDVDINKCEPWDLPEVACVGGKEWYFYNLRDRKYATGQRTNRATMSGYWKATGKDRQIVRKGALVGMRKTLVFYQGRAPKGKKTEWVMHEFRLEGRGGDPLPKISFKEDWVLCRVFYKSRGVGGMSCKPTAKESFYDDTGSSSLPPLTDGYITFDQTLIPPLNSNVGAFTTPNTTFEQVPCFSSYPQFPSQHFIPSADHKSKSSIGGFAKDLASSYFNPICDKKAIKSVLDHLSKLEGSHQMNRREDMAPSMAQASSQSYFSDAALSSSMWYSLQS